MFAATLDLPRIGDLPTFPPPSTPCALERYYPRICSELIQHWFRDDIDTYLAGLIMDDRSDRQGFPFEVIDELMFLSDLRWAMTNRRTLVEPGPVDSDDFTFVPHAKPSPGTQERKPWWRILGLR